MTLEISSRGKRVYADNLKSTVSDKTDVKKGKFSEILNSKMYDNNVNSLDQIFEMAAEKYNVPVNLLKSVSKAESGFNTMAESSAGAQGIMQLMPATARSLGVSNSFDPEQNIMGGAKYLRQMLDKFDGNVELSLAAYNAGPGNVVKYEGIPLFKETQNYVYKVMSDSGLNTDSLNNNYGNIEKDDFNTYNSNTYNSNIYNPEVFNLDINSDVQMKTLQSKDLDDEDYELMINLYRYKAQMSMLE